MKKVKDILDKEILESEIPDEAVESFKNYMKKQIILLKATNDFLKKLNSLVDEYLEGMNDDTDRNSVN